jgi:nucleoid-associated protein YgaU
MQDPFRPNSNAQLMREAQIGFIVVGLLLCVLVYVAFYRLTNRSSRFDDIARSVAVAQPVDGDPYQAKSIIQIEQKIDERLAGDRKGAFVANQEFSSMVKMSGVPNTSPDQTVAQVTHTSSHSASSDSIEKSVSTTLPLPKAATTGFVPVTKHVPPAPRVVESRSNPTDFDVDEFNPRNLPKKQPKVAPPVLRSKFGGTPNQDLLPTPISKKAETKTDPVGFEASVPLPLRENADLALQVPSKPKQPIPDSIDKALTRQLPSPPIKNRSNSFIPSNSKLHKLLDTTTLDVRQPNESSAIAQASAFEPVKAAPVSLPNASKEREKRSAKAGQTYTTQTGDSLWTIAQTVYGDGRYFRALYEMNHDTLSLSESIPEGTLMKVSTIEELQSEYPELCPKFEKDRRARDVSDAADTGETLDDELEQRFYRTEDGDTLFEIARQRLGQASRYLEIYELNRFRIPETANHLTPLGGGIQLLLPQ